MYINELLHHYTLRRSLRASDSNFLFSNIIQQNCVLDEGQSFLVDLLTLGMTAPFFAENVYRVKGYFFKKKIRLFIKGHAIILGSYDYFFSWSCRKLQQLKETSQKRCLRTNTSIYFFASYSYLQIRFLIIVVYVRILVERPRWHPLKSYAKFLSVQRSLPWSGSALRLGKLIKQTFAEEEDCVTSSKERLLERLNCQ